MRGNRLLLLISVLCGISFVSHLLADEPGGPPTVKYHTGWRGSRRWIGPEWWANPLNDWALVDGTAIVAANADRSLCLLPVDLAAEGIEFTMRVEIEPLGETPTTNEWAAGFRIGRRGGIDDYRHALVHANQGINAFIQSDGGLVLGQSESKQRLKREGGPVTLELRGIRKERALELTLSAVRGSESIQATTTIPSQDAVGGIALVADGPQRSVLEEITQRVGFRDFSIRGNLLRSHDDRSFGPILWSQYTLNNGRLRLQAQLAPLDPNETGEAELWVESSQAATGWQRAASSTIDPLSRTVRFTIDDWPSESTKRYQVRVNWDQRAFTWEGKVRREPAVDANLKLACFSCDNGYLFPIPTMVSQVQRQDPDVLYFAGDQIYESYGGFGVARGADSETAMLDYLRKYYQFGWTWRELLRDRPSIILPDDHDVFQGNIFGHGGRQLPKPKNKKKNNWDQGGYLMPGDWVNAVERTTVGHLPDPAVDLTLPIGIKPYFTSMKYGAVNFAILEDRKFKTGPSSLPEEQRAEGDGAILLGSEQEAFLSAWAAEPAKGRLRCALSQTIFCSAATHVGPKLKRVFGYYDSGAWPKAARNRTVRILGDCGALSIHGDQHLGILLRHGVDDFDDAGYAFMVPGTANGYPRAWWPGVDTGAPPEEAKFTGKFRDDAGHPIHVLAVGNPDPDNRRYRIAKDPIEAGYRRGSGYGLVEFRPASGTAIISLYRLGDQEELFRGFPQTIQLRP